MTGTRPVVDFMFLDFILDGFGELANQISKMQYMSSGRLKMPIVLRGCIGVGGAAVFANELISGTTLLGVLVVSGGIITLGLEQGLPDRHQWKPLSFSLLTGVWISAYTLTDALGVRHSENALGYITSLFMLEAVTFGLLIAFIRRQRLGGYVSSNWRSLLGGGIAAAGAYGLVIYVMNTNTIAIVAALRETSVVMAALIGTRLLKERFGPIRLTAAVMVTVGIILMNAGT